MTNYEPPIQFSLKSALWTLGVATIGWRIFTSPVNPAVSIPIALTVHVVMLVLVSRRPEAKTPASSEGPTTRPDEPSAREGMIAFAWLMLCPFVAAALYLTFMHLTGATEPGPIVPWVGIGMFILSLLGLFCLPVTLWSLVVVVLSSGPAFAEDPRYAQPFLAACFGTTMVIVRLYLDMMRV